MKQNEERREVSRSYVTGVVALVFMIIGYQTALFIHSAAVTKIAAECGVKDTVYIAAALQNSQSDRSSPVPEEFQKVENPKHKSYAEAVRRNLPYKKVESFRFNPNTASIEDLCRLGFSIKQAGAIDNYRKKGGRFRRKSDFAKSFVVSDSVFRRLESYIDIPLVDLNLADSSELDALPGIGGWFASKIIEHRKRLGGYSHKEQLLDIHKFDREKYDALSDLVTVSEENIVPYPLWTLPADSLRLHPYIGDYAAEGIVLYRENNPKELWTVDKLISAGIIEPEAVPKLRLCVISMP